MNRHVLSKINAVATLAALTFLGCVRHQVRHEPFAPELSEARRAKSTPVSQEKRLPDEVIPPKADGNVTRTVLPNGTRVFTIPIATNPVVAALVLYDVGSRFETPETNGAAHFVEHMVFRGTENRPEPGAISRELDALGAQNNAYTSQEYTGFWIRVEASRFVQAYDVLYDMVARPLLRQSDTDIERGAILQEEKRKRDDETSFSWTILNGLMYGDDPLGRPVLGTSQTISALNRDDLLTFRQANYLPSRTVVAIAGAFDERATLKMVKDTFGSLPPSSEPRPSFAAPRLQEGPLIALDVRQEMNQALFTIAFPTYGCGDDRQYATEVLANALGGGMSSRLFTEVRDKRGLAYSVGAMNSCDSDTGEIIIRAGVELSKAEEALSVIIGELKKLKNEPMSPDELERSVSNLGGSFALGMEASIDIASYYATQEILTGAPVSPALTLALYSDVSAPSVQDIARDIFRARGLHLVVTSRRQDTAPFLNIARELGE
jgi:predicted Zn-dependent peptidase